MIVGYNNVGLYGEISGMEIHSGDITAGVHAVFMDRLEKKKRVSGEERNPLAKS